KRTNYLTELLERHDRWKMIQGRPRPEDDDRRKDDHARNSVREEEDMWDFGTVRHVSQQTVGRNGPEPVSPTFNLNELPQNTSPASSTSGTTFAGSSSSINKRADRDLPPIPGSSANGSTARFAGQESSTTPHRSSHDSKNGNRGGTVRQGSGGGPLDDDEDDDDEVTLQEQLSNTHLSPSQDSVYSPMLNDVILPVLQSLVPRVSTEEAVEAIARLRDAFIMAERLIPGVTDEIVTDIVDSVEDVGPVQ
ncbi:putative protein serine/threonine kinase, partial [Tulasnella sp. 403]